VARFAQILPWLRRIFPPADAAGQLNPSEISEDVTLVHLIYTGTELLAQGVLEHANVFGTLGANSAVLIPRDAINTIVVFYATVTHNDPTAQFTFFELQVQNFPLQLPVTNPVSVAQNREHVIGRVIIVPQNSELILRAESIGGAALLSGQAYFARMAPGRPAALF